MVAVEIMLIIIGVAFLVGSFFIVEKLSQKDLDQITMMSESDLKSVAEKQVRNIRLQVETSAEEIVDESLEVVKRGLEKETNKKIMAVSEYSDTVIEQINKTHNEIIFLYSMLNDKYSETAALVGNMQKYAKQIREFDVDATMAKLGIVANNPVVVEKTTEMKELENVPANIEETKSVENIESDDKLDGLSKNERILALHQEGMNEVEIAKKLNCGLGEIRLVLGLYNEA